MLDTIMYLGVKERIRKRGPKTILTFEAFVQQGAPGASVLLVQAGSGFLSAPSPQEYCWNLTSTSCSQCRIASRDSELKRKSRNGFANLFCDSDRVHVTEGLAEEYLQRV